MTLHPGMRLGPYEIEAAIGAGGMGQVYRARDTRLNRAVAIKVLPRDAALDPTRLKRFEQEARAASALNHPGVLTIYDVGVERLGSMQDALHYIATELVDGETLRQASSSATQWAQLPSGSWSRVLGRITLFNRSMSVTSFLPHVMHFPANSQQYWMSWGRGKPGTGRLS